jgi:hypothetical protein
MHSGLTKYLKLRHYQAQKNKTAGALSAWNHH